MKAVLIAKEKIAKYDWETGQLGGQGVERVLEKKQISRQKKGIVSGRRI